jgi:hypothetical protein
MRYRGATMRRLFFFIPLSIIMLGFCIPSPVYATTRGIRVTTEQGTSVYLYKDYHALVVGVSNYERWPKLPNAVNDAREIAAKLKELGFSAKLVTDPTARDMQTLLSELVYDMGTEEKRAVLFYYAGHGETETLADGTKMGYLIPRDCPILERNPKGFATHAISMRDIESASLRIKAKHVLMLFDSCFSGSLFALVRAVPHDITEKSSLPVRQYITAGREDEQVPDKSMFKRCLLIGLEGDADLTGDGYITGSELGMYLSDKVVNYTHRRQHPQYGKINNPDLDRGDFIFALKARPEPKGPAALAPSISPRDKPKDELELLLRKAKEKDETERRTQEARAQKFRRFLEDIGKYREIQGSDLDETTKLSAWDILKRRYPEWTEGVEPSDSEALVRRALAGDTDGSLRRVLEAGGSEAQEEQVASIPKEGETHIISGVKLRDTAKEQMRSQITEMIKKYNFFEVSLNQFGDFPNDLVDNGDGTVTDRATGLMWQKGGSSSLLFYAQAEGYVSRLNRKRLLGYGDWRIPTVEELASLLEKKANPRGLHISEIFSHRQSLCWSSDPHSGAGDWRAAYGDMNHTVNFRQGEVDGAYVNAASQRFRGFERCFIRAVRRISEAQ